MFGAPLRAPGTAPKEEEGGPFGFLGEAKMPVLSGVVMLVVIVTAWFTGAVDIPLPGFLLLLTAFVLHTAVAIHVSGNIDKRPAAQRYDAKKIASNAKKTRAKKDT